MKSRRCCTLAITTIFLLVFMTLTVLPAVAAPGPICPPPTLEAGDNSNPAVVDATTDCSDSTSSITSIAIEWGPGYTTHGTTGTFKYTQPHQLIALIATDAAGLTTTVLESLNLVTPNFVTQGRSVQFPIAVLPIVGLDVNVTFSCVSANGSNGVQSLAAYHLSCVFPNGQSSYPLTLNGSGPSPSFQLTIQTNATSSAILVRPRTQATPMWATSLAVLPVIPAIILLGWARKVGGRRTNVARYIGLLVMLTVIAVFLACGSSSPPTSPGSYAITMRGTDSAGNSQATVLVGLQISQ